MSKRSSISPTALAVEPRPSRWLTLLQLAAALLALIAIARSGVAWPLRGALAAVLIWMVWSSLRRQGRFGGRAPCRRLSWRDGRWLWVGADGRSTALRLRRAVVWRHLVVMHFAGPGGPRSLCLLPDSLDADALRRLRLCLRHLPVYETGAEEEVPR